MRALGVRLEIGPYRPSCWCRLSPWLGLDPWADVTVHFTLNLDASWAAFLTRPQVVCERASPPLVYGPEVLQPAGSESVDVSIKFRGALVPPLLGSSGFVISSTDDAVVSPLYVPGL